MTTTVSTTIVVLLLTAVVLIGAALAAVILVYRAPVGGVRAQARTAWYVMRYDTALELVGVRKADRKARTDELRRSIADAAVDGGVGAALARLGDPKELAREENARRRAPAWGLGGAAALWVWLSYQFGVLVGVDVLANAVGKLAISDASLTVSTLFLPGITYDVTTDHTGAVDAIGTEYHLVTFLIPVLVFLAVSRSWRALSARRTRR
jgi:hypothetical protein